MSGPGRVALIGVALAAAVLPLPAHLVERWYSNTIYPQLQHVLTRASNPIPFSIFDLICLAGIVGCVLILTRRVREKGFLRGSASAASRILTVCAAVYLLFLATWGFNYRRVPLQEKLVFDATRLSPAATKSLAARTVSELNRLYSSAHATPASLDRLESSFFAAQRALGSEIPIVPGRPKQTLLGGYFHNAAIAGMTDPFLLETLIAPDLLEVERPFVIAHEWGHLAGYADESEANFIAWLACLRGEPQAQYSAWLTLFGHVISAAGNRDEVLKALAIGPRIDLRAISDRYANTPRLVRFAARETYDRYLKANRVERGVDSYDAVVELILGVTFDQNGNPQVR